VLSHLPKQNDPNILVGFNSVDDAGVYKIREDLAIVHTVDFFPPIVDDPYDFGAIAAANSLSDIYAMGAKPNSALNIVGYPAKEVPLWALDEILRGGAEKALEADVAIIGGHTIKTKEPIYGLAVVGTIHPQRIISNAGAKPGDSLILTKPLGTGIITTAIKKGLVDEDVIVKVVKIMASLNRYASESMLEVGINACTDVTGFGLLGHLCEMVGSSKVGARIYVSKVPMIEPVRKLAKEKVVPGGTLSNLRYAGKKVDWDRKTTDEEKLILSDAQTSGGLLISVPKERETKLISSLLSKGVADSAVIGEIIEDDRCRIQVKK
jgi:selenide,water dikinase